MAYIQCKNCGHKEELNIHLFVKILGGATIAGGFWAWVTYLFAGTGFALPICIAIVAGGAGIIAYSDEIIKWLSNKGYKCSNCGESDWQIIK